MARKNVTGRKVEKIKIEDYTKPKGVDFENMAQSKKNGFIFLRKEVLGKVPLYELDFLNKIRVVLDYINESTGKSARKLEAKRAKEVDRLSALEVVAGNFIMDRVEDKITKRSKRVGFQLDSKYNEVSSQLILKSSQRGMDLTVLEVNPNYVKYCKDIPVVAILESGKTNEI